MEKKCGNYVPFALFILSEKISVEYLNTLLERALDTSESSAGWYILTVVHITDPSDPYGCAPDEVIVRDGDRVYRMPQKGTRPPLDDSFVSPFLGKTVEDCARYLRGTPDKKDWNREHFCVLCDDDLLEDTVTLVRGFEHGAVHSFPCPVDEIWGKMMTMWNGRSFEEQLQTYQYIVEEHPDKDRSVGEAYELLEYEEDGYIIFIY
ncbi:hypothetical protein F4813DRAFT_364405 [Daldinia decipiens]|uniref:uncharacterized protein n=1 Tax=Daldinia decipiens TaxID=326647 RepID=UPI0020C23346|nr:uncharacterized protein F4813DRAFT_364405 [Daldinia decipiens]KAI1656459.1 hypothetical protein F4813DRAFT_364405 [Daldinia decipiens]